LLQVNLGSVSSEKAGETNGHHLVAYGHNRPSTPTDVWRDTTT
jgi:hypothetical protein